MRFADEELGYIVTISMIQIILVVIKIIDKHEFGDVSWWFIFIPVLFSIITGILIKILYCVFIPKAENHSDSITSIDTELAHHDANPFQQLKSINPQNGSWV
jgi:amino acid permease